MPETYFSHAIREALAEEMKRELNRPCRCALLKGVSRTCHAGSWATTGSQ